MNGYLIYYVLMEMMSVIVAGSILMLAWNSRQYLKHSFFLFLGVAYASVALLDLVHTMAYEGMGIFSGFTGNEPTQFWIAGRYLNAVSLLLAPFFLTHKVRPSLIIIPFTAVTAGLLTLVFAGWFPDCFQEDAGGLTVFKVVSEYVVCGIVAAAMGLLWHRRAHLEKRVLHLLLTAMFLAIATEMAFTLYKDVYGFYNILGHLFKICAFICLYGAVVVTGLRQPYEVLFRDLRLSEEQYRTLVSASPDAIIVRKDARILYANAAALNLYGAADYETLAAHDSGQLVLSDTEINGQKTVTPQADDGIRVHEGTILCMDGSQKPVEVRVSPVTYGGVSATQVIMRDLSARLAAENELRQLNRELRNSRTATLNLLQDAITARRQAEQAGEELRREVSEHIQSEQALRRSQDDLNRAQEVGNIGSWRLDIEKNKLTWSAETHRIFGIPPGIPMTYETFLSVVHADDREYFDTQWQAALKGWPFDIEHRIVVDGAIKWVREKAYLEYDGQGLPLSGFGISQDITHRKEIEDKLRQAQDELEDRVRQRTAELADTVDSLEREVRQRIAIETALRDSEENYRLLIDVSPEAVCVLVDEQIVFSNAAAIKLISAENFSQLSGRSIWDFIHPDFKETMTADISDILMHHDKIMSREISLLRLDGTEIEVGASATQVRHQDKQGILIVYHDITERKRAQQRINVTNTLLELFTKINTRAEYLDAVVNVIRDWTECECIGIRILDAEGKIPYEAWVGFSEAFLSAESNLSLRGDDTCLCIRAITQLSHNSDLPLATDQGSFHSGNTQAFLEKLSEGEKSSYRGNCVRHGFVSVAIVPIRYRDTIIGAFHLADKQPHKFAADTITFLENIAMLVGEAIHRFKIEESLQASRSRLLAAQRIAHLGSWQWDLTSGKLFWSDEIYRILGLEVGDVEPTYELFRSYVHPDDRQMLDESVDAAKEQGDYALDLRILKTDESVRHIHIIAEVIYDNSEPEKMSGTIHDVTEQKLAEQEIREHQRALRAMAAELQLAEERQRRQIAQDLHDSIGPILAFSTRELQTLKKNASQDMRKALEDISQKINKAIEQARTLSFDLSPSLLYDLGLDVAIEDLVDRFAAKYKIKCRFQTCPRPKPLAEDREIILYRSVRELLINAAKYANASQIQVTVSRQDFNVYIRVEDDGDGFDPAILQRESEKPKGFGLFSVRERLTHIGGSMQIESALGQGTTISLSVPVEFENQENQEERL